MSPVHHPHFQTKTHSYKNLDNARKLAANSSNYDSAATRARVITLFQERFGAPPREWQLDVTEAILLGLDSQENIPNRHPPVCSKSPDVLGTTSVMRRRGRGESLKPNDMADACVAGNTGALCTMGFR